MRGQLLRVIGRIKPRSCGIRTWRNSGATAGGTTKCLWYVNAESQRAQSNKTIGANPTIAGGWGYRCTVLVGLSTLAAPSLVLVFSPTSWGSPSRKRTKLQRYGCSNAA